MDLAVRAFKRVSAFFMYCVPGLQCVKDDLALARQRWGLSEILQYPHWGTSRIARDGVFVLPLPADQQPPEWRLDDIYGMALADTGASVLLTGARFGDSLWRRRQMATWGKKAHIEYPVGYWNKLQILGYLRMRGIPIPSSSGRSATGIDLCEPSLVWLHDTFPDDFERLCRVYPLARGMIKRREYFGDTEQRLGGKRAATAQA